MKQRVIVSIGSLCQKLGLRGSRFCPRFKRKTKSFVPALVRPIKLSLLSEPFENVDNVHCVVNTQSLYRDIFNHGSPGLRSNSEEIPSIQWDKKTPDQHLAHFHKLAKPIMERSFPCNLRQFSIYAFWRLVSIQFNPCLEAFCSETGK